MVSVGIFLVFSQPIPKENLVRTFGIVHLAGTPFCSLLPPIWWTKPPFRGEFPQNFAKWSSSQISQYKKIPYIPYRIYQPAVAGNLLIPAKLPVNRWDTTLIFIVTIVSQNISRLIWVRRNLWTIIRNGFMPHIMGHKLSHTYAREVRWNIEFDSWYSSKICLCLSKKNWHSLYLLFFDNVNFKRWSTSKNFPLYNFFVLAVCEKRWISYRICL
jgi:hypothetical protein